MALQIETFSNTAGGNPLFKALGHPLAAARGAALMENLAKAGPVALYDPLGFLPTFAALYSLDGLNIQGLYVQDVTQVGKEICGIKARAVYELASAPVETVLMVAFDADKLQSALAACLPTGAKVLSLDEMRLPEELLTNPRHYLAPLNWATNFAFFRDGDGHHTRVVTANYWAGYGAKGGTMWLCLIDGDGQVLQQWTDPLAHPNGTLVLDSARIRHRFNLPPFCGQLFIHIVGAAGHDVVKYAIDTYGDDDTVLSCTHDANAWPSDLYAGLPAPRPGEKVVLWVQNSHPCPIPKGEVTLSMMGRNAHAVLEREVAPFGTLALDVAELLPDAAWPEQFEIQAGKWFVRPRYEITKGNGRIRMAHVNVERGDLKDDPRLKELAPLLGKGFILPAPILPMDRFTTIGLPTPMSTAQENLPLSCIICDASGAEVLRHRLGVIERQDSVAIDIPALLAEHGKSLPSGFGHVELVYDFAEGGVADGWLHGIFRYEDVQSGHAAETSFGSHIFNIPMIYKSEPQSYAGRPPGLTTRLFLRLGDLPCDTICHLIYPASRPWNAASDTSFVLTSREGTMVAVRKVEIPCGGSHIFRYSEAFSERERQEAGPEPYVLIRDTSCRLFGYHGLDRGASFSLDHMFGF